MESSPETTAQTESQLPPVPEPEGLFMMERVVPAFFEASRAVLEERSEADMLVNGLIQTLRENATEAGEDETGLWTAAVNVFQAALIERRDAMELVEMTKALDVHPGYAWKTLCTLCYIGGTLDRKVTPRLAIGLHMGVAEFICRGTVHMPEVYERIIADWFGSYWTRTFENARFRFQGPRLVEIDLGKAVKSELLVRVQRTLRAAADGLVVPLPERGRDWFLDAS